VWYLDTQDFEGCRCRETGCHKPIGKLNYKNLDKDIYYYRDSDSDSD
jgi:hypothetical protein